MTAPWRSHCGRGCASATPIRRCCLARTRSSGCAPAFRAPRVSRPLAATAPLGARGHPPANTDATRLSDPFPPGVSTRSGSSPRACSRARRRTSTRSASSTRHARAWRRTAPSSGRARDPTRATRTTCACACAEKTKKTKRRGEVGTTRRRRDRRRSEETHEAASLVEVSCTCPAARTQAFRGDAQETRFGARAVAPPRAQPPRSCKHSTALLLWRARTLAAVADPELEVDEPTDPCVVDEARRETNERTTIPNVTERPAREVRKVPPAKRRRLPPSLAQSAAAAAEAAAGRAKRPTGDTPSREDPEDPAAVRERGKGKEKETPAPRARRRRALAVKREPGLGARRRGDAAENATTSPGVSLSRADREVVAKVQTVGDAALLDAARRAMRRRREAPRRAPRRRRRVERRATTLSPPRAARLSRERLRRSRRRAPRSFHRRSRRRAPRRR